MMIRTARRYDVETDTIVFADGMPYTRDNMRFAGLHDYVDSMFQYCRNMGKLGVDNAEYALVTAITIFSGKEDADCWMSCKSALGTALVAHGKKMKLVLWKDFGFFSYKMPQRDYIPDPSVV